MNDAEVSTSNSTQRCIEDLGLESFSCKFFLLHGFVEREVLENITLH